MFVGIGTAEGPQAWAKGTARGPQRLLQACPSHLCEHSGLRPWALSWNGASHCRGRSRLSVLCSLLASEQQLLLDPNELLQVIETPEFSLSQAHRRILMEVLDPAEKARPHILQAWVEWLQSCSGIPGDAVATAAGQQDLVGINVLKELSHFRQAIPSARAPRVVRGVDLC
jgi:hypothetical protein